MALPQTVTLQLLLVRSLMARASEALANGSDTELMSAMLLLDVACETITKAAHTQVGATKPQGDSVAAWLKELCDKIPAIQSVAPNAQRLRTSRNPVQHTGVAPSRTTVAASTADTKAFIELVAQKAFGVNFDEVSVTDLLTEPRVKTLLSEAIAARRAGDLAAGISKACGAFGLLITIWSHAFSIAGGANQDGFTMLGAGDLYSVMCGLAGTEDRVRISNRHFNHLQRRGITVELAMATMGLSVDELLRAADCVRRADHLLHPGRVYPDGFTPPSPPTASDVDFMVEVTARAAWRMEIHHPAVFTLSPQAPPRQARPPAPPATPPVTPPQTTTP